MVLLFFVSLFAMLRERSAKTSAAATESVRFQMMQNRLYLRNYLLSGDSREVDKMDEGIARLHGLVKGLLSKVNSDGHRAALQRLDEAERQWESSFARPLVDKRKQVDSGATTVAELQIYYLQLNPASWMKTSTAFLDEGEAANAKLLESERKKDEAEVRNNAESLVYQTEKLLKEQGENLPADAKTPVEDALAEVKKALEGTDIDAIKSATDTLQEKSLALGQAVYAAAQQAEAAAGGEGAPSGEPTGETPPAEEAPRGSESGSVTYLTELTRLRQVAERLRKAQAR